MNERTLPHQSIAVLSDPKRVAYAAASLFQKKAFNALKRKPLFTAALSGGSTPIGMFRLLATDPRFKHFPWEHTHLFWVDERCVPFDDPNSNFGNAANILLRKVPIPKNNIHPISCFLNAEDGAENYEEKIFKFFHLSEKEIPAFDLILLGVGKDGHIASLFPRSSALKEKKRLVLAVKGGEPNVNRVTLTLPVINNAKQILFLAVGKAKAKIVAKIIADRSCELPAAMVRPAKGSLYWIMDRHAASTFLTKMPL